MNEHIILSGKKKHIDLEWKTLNNEKWHNSKQNKNA